MHVMIRLRPDATAAADAVSGLPADLATEADALGVRIVPLHPGVADEQLARYLYADLDDDSRAADVADRLGQVPSVDSAYIKPPEGPP
jgi:hypothetical protein